MSYTIPRPASVIRHQKSKARVKEEREEWHPPLILPAEDELTPEQWALVQDNLSLGYWWLERLKRTYDVDTLHNEDGETLVKLALVQAARLYNPNHVVPDQEGKTTGKNVRFSTYATYWIRSYLMNEVRRHCRKPLTFLCDVDDNFAIDAEDYRTDPPHHHTDVRDRVEWVKKWFSDYDWQVLVWHYVDGLTEKQIAKLIDLAPQRVHQLLERIRRRVKMLRAEGRIS
jgi:RNA polymerase sigma factor (sigma-70 family)